MKNFLLETFPLYREGLKDAAKVTFQFYGGETCELFLDKSLAEFYMRNLQEKKCPVTIWEFLDQNYDMGVKWKHFRHVFKWKDGVELLDLNEEFVYE